MADRGLQVRCRVLAGLWIAAVIVVSVQATMQHNNNFEIFRTAWLDLLAGRDLYAPSPRHHDFFKYSPTFAMLFAPFAMVPFGLGVVLWNSANAGALYWGLGRVLNQEQAFAARLIVFLDTVGAMQNVQSNALVAGLMIIGFAELNRRRELAAAIAIAIGTIVKVFPIVAASFAMFRPYRLPRFALYSIVVGAALLAAPLVVLSPRELLEQYRSWVDISRFDALDRGYSVMHHLELWFRGGLPNWPVQLVAAAVLLAPLARLSVWGVERFRVLYLASVLLFCVLFNHKAESPTFVVAVAGVAIWFAVSARGRVAWSVLAIVALGTILSSSELMPEALQEGVFEPYRLKTIPVLLVWILTQVALWRRTASTGRPAAESERAAPAT